MTKRRSRVKGLTFVKRKRYKIRKIVRRRLKPEFIHTPGTWAAKSEIIEKMKRARATLIKTTFDLQEEARKHAEDAVRTLSDIMNNPDATDSTKVNAATAILDRAYGKPTQTNLNTNVNSDGDATDLNSDELEQRINRTLERVERVAGRTREALAGEEGPPDIRKRH